MSAEQPDSTSGLYVQRQPPLTNFSEWACAEECPRRLRSLVGPPGGGKSTYLERLAGELADKQALITLALPPVQKQDDTALCQWLQQEVRVWEEKNGPKSVWNPEPGSEFSKLLASWFETLGLWKPVLLLDGYDELPLEGKEWVEERILLPFLLPAYGRANGRAVVARRDEHGLKSTVLRWEEQALELKGLDVVEQQPVEQIRRRLAAVAGQTPDKARRLLEWPNAPNEAIAFVTRLDAQSANQLIEELKPFLTPNPFVNLLLLRRALQRGNGQLNRSDLHHCLDAYLQRADVPQMGVDGLVKVVGSITDPSRFRLAEYRKPTESQNPHPYPEIRQLMAAGMVAQIPRTSRHRFEPAVIQLCQAAR